MTSALRVVSPVQMISKPLCDKSIHNSCVMVIDVFFSEYSVSGVEAYNALHKGGKKWKKTEAASSIYCTFAIPSEE